MCCAAAGGSDPHTAGEECNKKFKQKNQATEEEARQLGHNGYYDLRVIIC